MRTNFATLIITALSVAGTASPLDASLVVRDDGKIIRVKEGPNSIQKAIDNAKKGTRIVIERGTYPEALTIRTNGISLEGKPGAVLIPPQHFVDNACTGVAAKANASDPAEPTTQAGICIQGQGIKLAQDFQTEHRRVASVTREVKDVSIKGLTVNDFPVNIMVIGARNTDIKDNVLQHGRRYGLLTDGSYDTTVKGNVVTTTDDTDFIAVCMDGFAGAKAIENKLTGYAIGFCVQTNGEIIKRNTIKRACSGISVDAHIDGVKIIDNSITEPKDPSLCGGFLIGVLLDGASDTEIHGNTIKGHIAPAPGGGYGILGFDELCTPANGLACLYNSTPSLLVGNKITNNVVRGNGQDIAVFESTPGANVVRNNDCQPATQEGALAGTCE
ncbi:hypothetical protein B0A48_06122 [Cryoendolithus antarcticus]|uniref:Periplasmic copper-binding protein NosD beta helix domain-containing protein n=1 Tax=Cryoendolithus antarcticus TaxID=1507870 RepID=A0A1V8TCX2_9PEZI|nr:hypothetical protein B0A48_06122 [Cryoendolithus antarcticus]